MTTAYFNYDDIDIESLTADEAVRMRDELVGQMKDIDAQLSSRNVIVNGERLSGNEFWTWRRSAVGAKHHKERLATALKRRAHEARQEEGQAQSAIKARWLAASRALLNDIDDTAGLPEDLQETLTEFRDVVERAERRAS